jgi:hypothetical protein
MVLEILGQARVGAGSVSGSRRDVPADLVRSVIGDPVAECTEPTNLTGHAADRTIPSASSRRREGPDPETHGPYRKPHGGLAVRRCEGTAFTLCGM